MYDTRTGHQLTFPAFAFELETFTPDSRQVVYGVQGSPGGGGVFVRDLSSKGPPKWFPANCVAFAQGGSVAAVGTDTTITVLNPHTWVPLRSFPGPGQYTSLDRLALTRDGRLLVGSTRDGVRVYDTATGWELAHFHSDDWNGRPDISADGGMVAFPSDRGVQVWEVGSRDRLMARALFRRLTGRR